MTIHGLQTLTDGNPERLRGHFTEFVETHYGDKLTEDQKKATVIAFFAGCMSYYEVMQTIGNPAGGDFTKSFKVSGDLINELMSFDPTDPLSQKKTDQDVPADPQTEKGAGESPAASEAEPATSSEPTTKRRKEKA